MQTTRQGFSAHVVKQGTFKGHALLAGGFDGVVYLNTIERYDPVAGNFFPFVANLNTARANHAGVELPDAFAGGRVEGEEGRGVVGGDEVLAEGLERDVTIPQEVGAPLRVAERRCWRGTDHRPRV